MNLDQGESIPMDLMNLEPESRIRFVGHDRLGYIPEKGVFDLLAGKQRYKTHEWGNPVQSYEQRYLIDAQCVLDMATGESTSSFEWRKSAFGIRPILCQT